MPDGPVPLDSGSKIGLRSIDVFAAVWGLLAIMAGCLLFALWPVWSGDEDYSLGFAVPPFIAWAGWTSLQAQSDVRRNPSAFGLLGIVAGCLAFPIGWHLFLQVGNWSMAPLWAMAAALTAAFGGALWCRYGAAVAVACSVPMAFLLFAIPLPSRLQGPLQESLKDAATLVSESVLRLVGLSVVRDGYVLTLPSGALGVEDACSGIRSLQTLTATAAVCAYVMGMSAIRTAALLALTLVVVVGSNSLRIVTTGLLQEFAGHEATEGTFHEIVGAVFFALGLAGTLAAAYVVRPGDAAPIPATDAVATPTPDAGGKAGIWAAACLAAVTMLNLWLLTLRPEPAEPAFLDRIPMALEGWEGQDVPISPSVRKTLAFDDGFNRVYRNPLGGEMRVWVLYWSTIDRGGPHQPDFCLPSRGWTAVAEDTVPIRAEATGALVPASLRLYELSGRRQLLMFWSQSGQYVVPPAQAKGQWTGTDSIARLLDEMVAGKRRLKSTARWFVLVSTDAWEADSFARRTMAGFVGLLAGQLYSAHPWALPDGAPPR